MKCGIKSNGRWLALAVLFCFCSVYLPADRILTSDQEERLRAIFEKLNQINEEQQKKLERQAESIQNSQGALEKLENSLKKVSESLTKLSAERDGWRTATLLTIAISGGILLGNWLLPQRVK